MKHSHVADAQAGQVDFVSRSATEQPSQVVGAAPIVLDVPVRHRGFEFLCIEVLSGRQRHRCDLPIDIVGGDRKPSTRFVRFFHSSGDAIGQDHPIFLGPIIVLAGADVPARTVEVNVEHVGHVLAPDDSGDAGKVRTGNTGAIIALRMTGVVGEHRNGLVFVPKRKRTQLTIDDPLRLGPQAQDLDTWCSGLPARFHLSSKMRRFDATCLTSATPKAACVIGVAWGIAAEIASSRRSKTCRASDPSWAPRSLTPAWCSSCSAEKSQRGASCWCNVWTATRWRARAGGAGESIAKGVMPFISNPNPIDRAEYDRLVAAKDHDSPSSKPQLLDPFDPVIGHHETDLGRGIHVKLRNPKGGRRFLARSRQSDKTSQKQKTQNGWKQILHGFQDANRGHAIRTPLRWKEEDQPVSVR